MRRITREMPNAVVIEDIQPQLNGISELEACKPFGGSKDIATEIFVAHHISYDTRDASETKEAPVSLQRRREVEEHRCRVLAWANAGTQIVCAPIVTTVTFSSDVIIINNDNKFDGVRLQVIAQSNNNLYSINARDHHIWRGCCRRVSHSNTNRIRNNEVDDSRSVLTRWNSTNSREGETKNSDPYVLYAES